MITRIHYFLIGLEEAENRAEREHLRGWGVSVLDPGNNPDDYHWRIAGEDALVYAVDPIPELYVNELGVTLMAEGGRMIMIFDNEGNLRFAHFLGKNSRRTSVRKVNEAYELLEVQP